MDCGIHIMVTIISRYIPMPIGEVMWTTEKDQLVERSFSKED